MAKADADTSSEGEERNGNKEKEDDDKVREEEARAKRSAAATALAALNKIVLVSLHCVAHRDRHELHIALLVPGNIQKKAERATALDAILAQFTKLIPHDEGDCNKK